MKAYGIVNLTSEGFFHDLWEWANSEPNPIVIPFLYREDIAKAIDKYYYYVHSGDKLVNKMIRTLYDYDDEELPFGVREHIVSSFWNVYSQMLSRQWGNYTVQYDATQPYDVHEETGYDHSARGNVTNGGQVTKSYNGSTLYTNGEQTDTDSVWGFNSTNNPVNSDKTVSGQRTDTESFVGRSDVVQDATTKATADSSRDDLETHKYGTLGTMPMGDIMNKEIQTWMWNFYIRCLFPAVDKTLTIPIY